MEDFKVVKTSNMNAQAQCIDYAIGKDLGIENPCLFCNNATVKYIVDVHSWNCLRTCSFRDKDDYEHKAYCFSHKTDEAEKLDREAFKEFRAWQKRQLIIKKSTGKEVPLAYEDYLAEEERKREWHSRPKLKMVFSSNYTSFGKAVDLMQNAVNHGFAPDVEWE